MSRVEHASAVNDLLVSATRLEFDDLVIGLLNRVLAGFTRALDRT